MVNSQRLRAFGAPRAVKGCLAALAILAVLAQPARAGEDDRLLSVWAGFGSYAIPEPDHSPRGAVLGVDFERAFSESVAFRVSGLGGYYFAGGVEDADSSVGLQASAGLTYFVDILKYVPYATVGLGGVYLLGGPGDGTLNGLVEFGVGLDVLHSREFSYGIQARFDSFAQETSVFTAGVRATYRWGFF